MIKSFQCSTTEDFYYKGNVKKGCKWAKIKNVAGRKLDMLDAATCLKDLLAPPSNRLEALKGDLKGYHSIRINNQWRLIFIWNDKAACATDVYIDDYH